MTLNKENIFIKNLKYEYFYEDMLNDKLLIISKHIKIKGIYLLYNKSTLKYYIGSSNNLSKRLKDYYQESKLMDKRYISKSINKYGHNNFSVFILETSIFTKNICILEREQYYIDLYNPEYNIIKKVTEIQKGYKHKNKSKKLISESKKGEKNIFYGKKHTEITKKHLSESKKGEKNPMYDKPKSLEFLYYANRERKGGKNPMYGKPKSAETLLKLRKCIYVYDEKSKKLIIKYESFKVAVEDLKMGKDTLRKYALSNKPFRGRIFSYKELL